MRSKHEKGWRAIYKSLRTDSQASGVREAGTMGRLVAGLVASSVILGMFVFVSPPARAQGNAPQWTAGDYWEYTGQVEIFNASFDALVRQEVEGTSPLTMGGMTYDTYRCRMTLLLTGLQSNHTASGEKNVQLSTLSPVRSETTMDGRLTNITYQPPFELYRFPLHNGQNWSTTSFTTITYDGNSTSFNWTQAVTVSGPETIVVPAGTFEAFNETARTMEPGHVGWPSFYSDDVGNEIRAWGSFLGTIPPFLMELKSYNYQHASGLVWVLLIVVIVVVAVAAVVAALLVISRKKRRMTPPVPPQG